MADNNTLKHVKVSSHSDNPDTTLVNPSDWNHEHHFNNGTTGQVLKWDSTKTDNVTFGEAIDAFTTAGLPGPGRIGRLIYVTDGKKGLRVDNGSILAPITPIIDVVEFATSGDGSQANPWLGWEAAFSAIASNNYFGVVNTSYSFCHGWFSTPYTMVPVAFNSIYGTGINTVIKYTGGTIGINLNGTVGNPSLTNGIQLRNFFLRSVGGTVGISVYNVSGVVMHNVRIEGRLQDGIAPTGWITAGLQIAGSAGGFAVVNFFSQCKSTSLVGDALRFSTGTDNVENIIFDQCSFQGVAGHCVNMLSHCINVAFHGCEIEGSTLSIVNASDFYNLTFQDCAFEGANAISLLDIGTTAASDACGPFYFTGNYILQSSTGYHMRLGIANNVAGGTVSNNLFTSPVAATAIQLGSLIGVDIFGNRGGSAFAFSYTAALLDNCHIEDWNWSLGGAALLTRVFWQNYNDTVLRLMRSSNVSGELTSMYFGTRVHPILAKLSCLNIDQTVNAGAIIATVGIGSGTTITDVMKLNIFGTAANDTAMMLYDVTAGTLQRVTIGIANSGGAGFRLLRIPN